MTYCNRPNLVDYLANFTRPPKAIVCPFVQSDGAGMGMAVFSLFVFAGLGLGLTIRTQHPGPLLVAGILTVGTMTLTLPGLAAQIAALVLFFGISALGLYLYSKANRTL